MEISDTGSTKPSVYIETSLVSYLTARPSRDLLVAAHQQLTVAWWDEQRTRYELFTVTVQVVKTGITPQLATSDRFQAAKMEPLHPAGRLHMRR